MHFFLGHKNVFSNLAKYFMARIFSQFCQKKLHSDAKKIVRKQPRIFLLALEKLIKSPLPRKKSGAKIDFILCVHNAPDIPTSPDEFNIDLYMPSSSLSLANGALPYDNISSSSSISLLLLASFSTAHDNVLARDFGSR